MQFWHKLRISLVASLFALPVGCTVIGFGVSFWMYFTTPGDIGANSVIGLGFAMAIHGLVVSAIPTVVCWVPVYAFLALRRRNSTWITIVIGLIPGIMLLFISKNGAIPFMMLGALTGVLTHAFAKRKINVFSWMNNSGSS